MITVTIATSKNKQQVQQSHESYASILANLSNSKQAWLELLKWNGINYIWQEMLDLLLQSEKDLHEWNNWWNGNIDDLVTNISDYRQHRLKQNHSKMTLDEFELLFKKDIRKALERLFMEPMYDYVIDKLEVTQLECNWIYHLRMQGKVERVSQVFAFVKDSEVA